MKTYLKLIRWYDWAMLFFLIYQAIYLFGKGEIATAGWVVIATGYYVAYMVYQTRFRALGLLVLSFHAAYNKQTRELEEARRS